jgi:hypothetical protein
MVLRPLVSIKAAGPDGKRTARRDAKSSRKRTSPERRRAPAAGGISRRQRSGTDVIRLERTDGEARLLHARPFADKMRNASAAEASKTSRAPALALELRVEDLSGANWNRPDSLKQGLRAVVGQQAT